MRELQRLTTLWASTVCYMIALHLLYLYITIKDFKADAKLKDVYGAKNAHPSEHWDKGL
jgi:hypothetical protein